MKIECMKNLIYTFVSSITFVLLIGCSAEFENGTPEPWQREINPNENYEYTIKHPCLVNTEADFERARRKVNERAERTGRNPKTGEAITIAAAKVPTFKAGKALKEAVN